MEGLDFLEGGWDEEVATPLPFDLITLLIYLHKSKQSPNQAQCISTQATNQLQEKDRKSYRIGEPNRFNHPMHTQETRQLVTMIKTKYLIRIT